MEIPVPPKDIALAALRAMKTVAVANEEFDDLEVQLLSAIGEHLFHLPVNVDTLETISPKELKDLVTDKKHHELIIHSCVMMAMIDGETKDQQLKAVDDFANALNVHDHIVKDLHRFVDHHFKILRIDVMRSAAPGEAMKGYVKRKGLKGIYRLVKAAVLHKGDKKLHEKYLKLSDYPEGTLGKAYYNFITGHGWELPGGEGAGPEAIAVHDCYHVLGDYDITTLDESQVAAFQGASGDQDPFSSLMFAMLQFQVGVQITPSTTGFTKQIDPDLWIKALERGSRMTCNLAKDWDPWDHFDRPVDELRREYNILPKN